MQCAILADIHANLNALEAVLEDACKRSSIDEMWCLGDIVGYGPDPHECIEVVRKYCSVCVAGNHDWASIGKMDTSNFNPEAAAAAHWTSQHLKLDDIRFLESLPLTLEKSDFTLAHGSPRDPIWEYLFSPVEAEENLKYFQTPYCLVGHSHVPLWFECSKFCSKHELSTGKTVNLGRNRLIINPGGVGQPRDFDPRASYAVYDSAASTVTLHRIKYDIQATQRRMQAADLPGWLISRLETGQ